MREEIRRLAKQYQFFHWHLAFPQVFRVRAQDTDVQDEQLGCAGGFDVVLGNPPWEKINLKDEEFFAESYPEIAGAKTKSQRKKLIAALKGAAPEDFRAYVEEQEFHDRQSSYFRHSTTYPMTGVSRINLYSLFAELAGRIVAPQGRFGLVVSSGIATDENNKALFEMLVQRHRLISVWDFENRDAIFPDVHRMYKFCLFCGAGVDACVEKATFAFFMIRPDQIHEPDRVFSLSLDDLVVLNPESKTCPTFRNTHEAELTKAIYRRVPAWSLHESTPEWPGIPKTPFNTANDSEFFHSYDEATEEVCGQCLLPAYEAKFIHQFNHRFATAQCGDAASVRELTDGDLLDPHFSVIGRFYISRQFLRERYPAKWYFAYRKITNATNDAPASQR